MNKSRQQLRNQRDFRRHVLCEAGEILRDLPMDARRDAVLLGICDVLIADFSRSERLQYEKALKREREFEAARATRQSR